MTIYRMINVFIFGALFSLTTLVAKQTYTLENEERILPSIVSPQENQVNEFDLSDDELGDVLNALEEEKAPLAFNQKMKLAWEYFKIKYNEIIINIEEHVRKYPKLYFTGTAIGVTALAILLYKTLRHE